jgi:hypothetical protein
MAWNIPADVPHDLATVARRLSNIDNGLVKARDTKVWTEEQRALLAEFQFALANLTVVVSSLVAANGPAPAAPSTSRWTTPPV